MKAKPKKSKTEREPDFLIRELEKRFGSTSGHFWNSYGGSMDGVHNGYLDIAGDDIPMNADDAHFCSYVHQQMKEILKRLKAARPEPVIREYECPACDMNFQVVHATRNSIKRWCSWCNGEVKHIRIVPLRKKKQIPV